MSEPPSSQDDSSKSTEECLIYLEQYGALICKLCRYALCPNGVALHYQRHHKNLLSASQRRELIRFEQSVTVVDTQQLILNSPRDVGPAILGLKVIKAQECLQCAFIGGTERSIQEHCRSIHKWRHQDGLSWRECHAQSFFSGTNKRGKYFKVLPPETSAEDLNKATLT